MCTGYSSTGTPRMSHMWVPGPDSPNRICLTVRTEQCQCNKVSANGCPAACDATIIKKEKFELPDCFGCPKQTSIIGWENVSRSAYLAEFDSFTHSEPETTALKDAVLEVLKQNNTL